MELVPIPAVLSAPYAGVQLSEEAARAPGRGLQSAGRSLMDVGGQLEEFGQRMQVAKDNVDLLKAQLAIDEVTAEEEQWRAVNPDEALWEPRALESVTKVDKKIAELKLSKSAKDRLLPTLMEFRQKHPTTVKYAAMQKRVESLRQTGVTFSRIEAGKGNLDKADAVIDQLVTDGVMKKEAAWIEKQSNGRIATVANVKRMYGSGAAGADRAAAMLVETDKDGNYVNYADTLSQDDRTALRNAAEQQAAHFREQRGQWYMKRIYEARAANDPTALVGMDTELDMDVKTKGLLATQASNIKRLLTDSWNPQEVMARSGIIMDRISKLNPGNTSEWNAGVLLARMQATGLPDGARKTIEEAITRQQKVASSGATKLPAGVSAEEKLTRVLESDGFGPYVGLAKPQYEVEMVDVEKWKFGWGWSIKHLTPFTAIGYPTAKKEKIGKQPVLDAKGLPQFVRNADTGEPIIDPKKMAKQAAKREKAMAAHAQAQLALQAWRKQHPDANEADALKWVDDYLVARKEDDYYNPKADDTAP